MRKKNFLFICALLCISFCFISCSKEESSSSIEGVWGLALRQTYFKYKERVVYVKEPYISNPFFPIGGDTKLTITSVMGDIKYKCISEYWDENESTWINIDYFSVFRNISNNMYVWVYDDGNGPDTEDEFELTLSESNCEMSITKQDNGLGVIYNGEVEYWGTLLSNDYIDYLVNNGRILYDNVVYKTTYFRLHSTRGK